MNQIDRIAMSTGWQPTDWQRALSETLPAMAVFGLFKDAQYVPQRRIMTFPHREQLQKAVTFQRGVSEALGAVVMVSADHE